MSQPNLVVQQFIDHLKHGTIATSEDLLAPDLVVHVAEWPVSGKEAVMLLLSATYDAFRDVQLEHEILSASPGVVVVTFDARGVQQREFFGLLPTGREARLKGIAVLKLAGSVISEIQVFAEMARLFRTASAAVEAEPGGRQAEEEAAASTSAITVRDIWLAGLGAVATAEEYGIRVFNALLERGKVWEPVARTSTARAVETIGGAASTATSAVRGLGDRIKSARSTGEAALTQFVKSRTEQSPTREEFESLKHEVEALVARFGTGEHQALSSSQTSPSD
jgi:poly(hydroxyalkanoate) granule-associated protein